MKMFYPDNLVLSSLVLTIFNGKLKRYRFEANF